MAKVVLINVKENFTPVPPLGILYLATFLKEHGHQSYVFDVNFSKQADAIQKIKNIDPDIIGFSAMTTNYSITEVFNKQVREICPHSYYCWGGIHATALPADTIKNNKLDFIVYGEGEETLLEICNKITNKKKDIEQGIDLSTVKGVVYYDKGQILQTELRPYIEDLDSLPFPDRSLLDNFQAYLAPPGLIRLEFMEGTTNILASRGCFYQCIFCASKLIHGRNIRMRSPKNIIQEMRFLNEKFGITGINFGDDTFGANREWIIKFCEEFKKSGLDMIWCCQTRANIAQDIETLQIIKDAGCVQVDIGCESGSDKILETLKKGINAKMILKSFENLKKLKMRSYATFIIGNPGETMEDIEKTLELAKQAPAGGVSYLILVPYPGSPLYQMAKENNWFIEENTKFDERWTNKETNAPVMEASFKADELIEIRNRLQNSFFFRNNIGLVMPFLKSPKYLFKLMSIIVMNPRYLISAVCDMDARSYLENIYQKFNEKLQKNTR